MLSLHPVHQLLLVGWSHYLAFSHNKSKVINVLPLTQTQKDKEILLSECLWHKQYYGRCSSTTAAPHLPIICPHFCRATSNPLSHAPTNKVCTLPSTPWKMRLNRYNVTHYHLLTNQDLIANHDWFTSTSFLQAETAWKSKHTLAIGVELNSKWVINTSGTQGRCPFFINAVDRITMSS